ncbi:MAG: DarT ssDNA thymidine ADP-ribosyltransferase family protein [Rhodoglobus sp.]
MNLLDQRVFHVTHVRNLERIVDSGAVLASAHDSPAPLAIDLSSPLARELRATAEVTLDSGGRSVAAFVPWYLSADASVWQELRRGAAEPRWSGAARAAASVDFVVLVSTVRALAAQGSFVVADGDAAATFTRFASNEEQAMRMLARLHNTEQVLDAELLVPNSVPFAAVQLIGAANEPQRDRVRGLLDAASVRTKVMVHPPWFAAPETRAG